MIFTSFKEKFNKLDNNYYTVEEEVVPTDGVYEADLIHDNIEPNSINVYTGKNFTGDKVNSYTVSTPSLTPWRTHIRIYTSASVLFITYETIGDTVEAEDINGVQDAINDTQNVLNDEITRSTNKDKELEKKINDEVTRAKNAENTLTTNLNNEITRAKKAESTLTTNLNNEITRAKNAESTLTKDLSSEVTRATTAENTLQTNLNTTNTNLNNEITRAQKAEKDISDIITTNRSKWEDKYTKAEVDNKVSLIMTNTAWKDSVNTYSDLATTYPSPNAGWTVYVEDTGYTYRYDGGSWVKISTYNLPLATASNDGRMSKEDKSFLDTVKSKWSSITSHIADTVKHITSAERTLWNTVSDKVNKSGDTMTGKLTLKKNMWFADKTGALDINNSDVIGANGIFFKDACDSNSEGLFFPNNPSADYSYDLADYDCLKVLNSQLLLNKNKVYHEGYKPKLSELTNDAGFITVSDIDTSQNHIHKNKTVLDGITSTNIADWNDGVRRIAFVGSDVANSNGWYKVAEQTCSGYGDTNITFMVTSTYTNYNYGILQLQMRSDNTNISCKSFKWLTKLGLNNNHYIIKIDGMKWTLYAHQPCPRYGRIAFEILSMSGINSKTMTWGLTFKDNNTPETTAPTATVTSSDGGQVAYAINSTRALQDNDGKQINTTYVKKGMTWNELEGV